ncbi:MAG: NB-ARC domain-containing protein, partial [Thermomicrobiales bacterium]
MSSSSGLPYDPSANREIARPRRPLIGRATEAESLSLLLLEPDVSLVTVTGPGGVGKTTLATHVASSIAAAFPSGVVVIPLAQVAEIEFVVHAVARALGLRETGQTSVGDQLVERLQGSPVLLVLDTFEHLIEAAPDIAGLVAACPELTCLVTSRTPLHLREEREFPLKPLSTSINGSADAVSLFMERAKAVEPAFAMTTENAKDIEAICRRLDGLPLAIELAAARIRLLPPRAMLRKLDDPLPLLKSGARDAPERQRTMRDTIAWSYNLLDPDVRQLFRLLSIFRGTISLDAIEATAAGLIEADVLEALSSLVDHSLVEPAGIWSEARYRLLDTVREFGLELLGREGEREGAQERHARWFRDQTEHAATFWWGSDHFEWLDQIELDIDNLRQALSWFDSTGDIESAARLAIAMYGIWRVHGPVSEGWTWYERILARSDMLPIATRALLHLYHDGMAWVFRDQTHEWDQTGYHLALESGDSEAIAMGLVYVGATSVATGDVDVAQSAFRELARMGESASPGHLAYGWMSAGLEHLAAVARDCGEIDDALVLAREAVNLAEQRGFAWGYPMILATLADIERIVGLRDAALEHFREAIQLVWPQRQPRHAAAILAGYAALAADEEELILAARLLGAADRLVRSDGVVLPAYSRAGHDALLDRLRTQLGDDPLQKELEHGRSWSSDETRKAAETAMSARRAAGVAMTAREAAHPLSAREVEVLRLVVE